MLDLIQVLSSHKFTAAMNEKELQQEIEAVLRGRGYDVVREARISEREVVDFLVGAVAVEIKVRGSAMAHFRQVNSYLKCDSVQGLILMTWRRQCLPSQINGKPVSVICMADSWL